MSYALSTDLFLVKDGINKRKENDGREKEEVYVLQFAALRFLFVLSDLLRESLGHEDEALLLQVLTSYLLLYIN